MKHLICILSFFLFIINTIFFLINEYKVLNKVTENLHNSWIQANPFKLNITEANIE